VVQLCVCMYLVGDCFHKNLVNIDTLSPTRSLVSMTIYTLPSLRTRLHTHYLDSEPDYTHTT